MNKGWAELKAWMCAGGGGETRKCSVAHRRQAGATAAYCLSIRRGEQRESKDYKARACHMSPKTEDNG